MVQWILHSNVFLLVCTPSSPCARSVVLKTVRHSSYRDHTHRVSDERVVTLWLDESVTLSFSLVDVHKDDTEKEIYVSVLLATSSSSHRPALSAALWRGGGVLKWLRAA